jgi:autotransporter-associated beta strand protein
MLVLGANQALPTTTALNLGGTDGSGTLKLNGWSQTVAGLTTNVTTTTNKLINGNATAGALTVNNSAANAFAGVLGGTGTDENNFALTKGGAGTLTLSGTNTYTGTTTVTGGSLALAASGSLDSNQIALNGGVRTCRGGENGAREHRFRNRPHRRRRPARQVRWRMGACRSFSAVERMRRRRLSPLIPFSAGTGPASSIRSGGGV